MPVSLHHFSWLGPLRLATLCVGVALPSVGSQVSGNFEDLSAQATSARQNGDVRDAIELYSRAVNLNPSWAEGWWFLGSMEYSAESYPAAQDALSHYLRLMPEAPPALALRGLCEFETRAFPQALRDLELAIARGAANQPRNEQILRYHYAQLLTRVGRFDDALKAYGFFAQKGISNPELFIAIGLAGIRMALLPKEAPSDQQDLLRAVGKAGFQFLAGDENGTAAAFQAVFQRFPNAANVHYFYGTLLYSSDPDISIEQFKAELQVSPDSESAQVMTPWAMLMRNRPADALTFARRAAEKLPNVAAAQLVLGRALAETGTLPEGVKYLEQSLKIEPGNLETHIALAKAYSRLGKDDDARRERQFCLQMTKDEKTYTTQR